ncbi:MAG: argininosuccinate lyase, partial [Herminiimonas sp.]|nr:argininosuccinate lyase [Herminiimonas sp.]
MLKHRFCTLALLISAYAIPCMAQQPGVHDEFFWLGQMNKATAVINTDEGLLEKSMAPRIAAGIEKVIENGNKP